MAAKKASISVSIIGDATQARAAFKQAEDAAGSLGEQMKSVGKTVAGAFATGAIIAFAKGTIQAAEEAQIADQRIQQIATSMGIFGTHVAEVTKRMSDYAEQVMYATGIDDEQIKAVQAKLLTFKDLAVTADSMGGAFDRATIAAVDMAAAGFGSAESNAVALGKALQDPINGLTALRRVGITFTASQKEMIASLVETNRVGEAQAVILGVIEQKFGGTAAATATESSKMKVAFGELQEQIGGALLPAFEGIVSAVGPVVKAFAALPAPVREFVAIAGLAGALGKSLSTSLQGMGVSASTAATSLGLLGVAFVGYSMAQSDAANDAKKTAEALGMLVQASDDELRSVLANYVAKRMLNDESMKTIDIFKDITRESVAKAQKLVDLGIAQNDLGISTAEANKIIGEQVGRLKQTQIDADNTSRAVSNLTASQSEYEDELADGIITADEMTDSLQEQETALQAVTTATLAQFNAALAYEQQSWSTTDAVEAYTIAQLDAAFGTKSAEEANRAVEEASNAAAQAALRQAASAAKLAEDQAKAQGATLSAAEAARIQIAELEKVAQKLSPDDPLRQRLNQYVAELKKIPSNVRTELEVAVTAYVRTIKESKDGTPIAGRGSGTSSTTTTKRAFGGPVLANSPYLVGENGPELFVPRAGGQIIPNTGGSHVTINVYGSVVSERDLVEKIRQGLIDAQRSGRPVVFQP